MYFVKFRPIKLLVMMRECSQGRNVYTSKYTPTVIDRREAQLDKSSTNRTLTG